MHVRLDPDDEPKIEMDSVLPEQQSEHAIESAAGELNAHTNPEDTLELRGSVVAVGVSGNANEPKSSGVRFDFKV